MTQWPIVRMTDVCNEITVGHVGKMSDQYIASGVPFLRSQDIHPGRIDFSTVKFIPSSFHQQLRKSKLTTGDVVMVRTGYPGTAAVVPPTLPDANCADLVIARPGPKLDPHFLAYTMNSPLGRGFVRGSLVGVAQQHFNVKVAAGMKFPLPPLPIQRRIVSILGAYDDLIEVNRRRIAVLEEMARRLFDEWFVHFRFPGHESVQWITTPLGDIPRGWEVRSVEEIVQRIPVGKKYDQKAVNPIGAVPVLDQGKTGVIGYHYDAPGVDASEQRPVVAFANHTCYQRLIHYSFSAIQNVLPFVPNPKLSRDIYWLHWATNGLVAINDYKGHWPEFAAKKLAIPTANLCQQFGDHIKPLAIQTLKFERANENLRKTRDLLLPRLISGDLSVAADEVELESAG